MRSQRLVEVYIARARELECRAERFEQNPNFLAQISPGAGSQSPNRRSADFLRREAGWWRAYAEGLATAA